MRKFNDNVLKKQKKEISGVDETYEEEVTLVQNEEKNDVQETPDPLDAEYEEYNEDEMIEWDEEVPVEHDDEDFMLPESDDEALGVERKRTSAKASATAPSTTTTTIATATKPKSKTTKARASKEKSTASSIHTRYSYYIEGVASGKFKPVRIRSENKNSRKANRGYIFVDSNDVGMEMFKDEFAILHKLTTDVALTFEIRVHSRPTGRTRPRKDGKPSRKHPAKVADPNKVYDTERIGYAYLSIVHNSVGEEFFQKAVSHCHICRQAGHPVVKCGAKKCGILVCRKCYMRHNIQPPWKEEIVAPQHANGNFRCTHCRKICPGQGQCEYSQTRKEEWASNVFNPQYFNALSSEDKRKLVLDIAKNSNFVHYVSTKVSSVPVFQRVQDEHTGEVYYLESHEVLDEDEDVRYDDTVTQQTDRIIDESDMIDIHDVVRAHLNAPACSEEYQRTYAQYDAFLDTLVDGLLNATRAVVNDQHFSVSNTVESTLANTDEQGITPLLTEIHPRPKDFFEKQEMIWRSNAKKRKRED